MKYIAFVLNLGLVAVLTTACQSQSIFVAEPQVETPEVAGRTWDWGVRAEVTPARSVKPFRSPNDVPPDERLRTEATQQSIATFGAATGLGNRVEVGAAYGAGLFESGCGTVNGKLQIYGPPRSTAKQGDLALGVSAHAYLCQTMDDGETQLSITQARGKWKEHSASQSLDVGISIGYHVLDKLMIYGGVALGEQNAESKVDQDPSMDASRAGGSYSAHVDGEAQSIGFGLNYGGSVAWANLRFNYAHSNYDYINPDHSSAGLGAGFNF